MPPTPPASFLLLRLPSAARQPISICSQCQSRSLHRLNAPQLRVPKPTPFVPDATTFLTLIGRSLSKHASQIPSWEALFTLSSEQLKEAGVEPPRARRYLLWWRDRFRHGIYGIGGDLKNVKDGVGELRIVQIPAVGGGNVGTLTQDPGMRKVVVNTPIMAESGEEKTSVTKFLQPPMQMRAEEALKAKVAGVKVVRATVIGGTGVEAVKGHQGVARLRVKEGLWEQRRGHKVDGGERRKAEVRAKRRATERKKA